MRLRVKVVKENYEALQHDHQSSDSINALSIADAYANTVEKIMQESADDPIQWLAASAVNGSHVFEVLSDLALRFGNMSSSHFSSTINSRLRMVILDLIRHSPIEYGPDAVSAALSTLTGGQT